MCLKNQGYSTLYNANLHKLTCKMTLLQKVKENIFFFFYFILFFFFFT